MHAQQLYTSTHVNWSYRVVGLADNQLDGLRKRLDRLALAEILALDVGSGIVGGDDVLVLSQG